MIQIQGLHKKFNKGTSNEVYALRGIDLEIRKGEFVTVIGTNGSGKSTLLNAIAGTFFPDKGRILINERDVTRKPEYSRAVSLARVFQNPFAGTAPAMTVAENLQIASLRGRSHPVRLGLNHRQLNYFRQELELMEMGLEDRLHSVIGTLSGGQRQAVSLLMAVLRRPDILLLDEHTAALDPRSAAQIIKLTRNYIQRDDLTALMITHSMMQAISNGNRLVMMHNGRIIHDVAEDQKKNLVEKNLLAKFEQVKKEEKLTAEMIQEFSLAYL